MFSLDHYGARGNGRHDDTQALEKAWKAACASAQPAVVLVPKTKRERERGREIKKNPYVFFALKHM